MAEQKKKATGRKGKSPHRKRTVAQVATDFKDICKWRAESPAVAWRDIAEKISRRHSIRISHETLYAEYYRKCRNITDDARSQHIERECAGIQQQIDALWTSWHRSTGVKTKKKIKTISGGTTGTAKNRKKTEPKTEKEMIEEEMIGDPAIMAQITKLREQRMRLLGLMVQKTAFTDGDGDDVEAVVTYQVQLPDNGRKRTDT